MYLLFFTYTGAGMDVVMLYRNLGATSLIFVTRSCLIVISTLLGGKCAASPPEHYQRYWMAFLTQAGVTLGLAQSASAHFQWGPDFAATIVAVVVCNQVVGPPLLKRAIKAVGEQYHNYQPSKLQDVSSSVGQLGKAAVALTGRPQPRGVLVIGREGWEVEIVVNRLRASKWEVLLASEDLSVYPATGEEKQRLVKRSEARVSRVNPMVHPALYPAHQTNQPADGAPCHLDSSATQTRLPSGLAHQTLQCRSSSFQPRYPNLAVAR